MIYIMLAQGSACYGRAIALAANCAERPIVLQAAV